MATYPETRDFGLPRTVATLVFAALVADPLAQVFRRVDLGAAMPVDLVPTALFSLKQASLSLAACLLVGVPLGVFYAGVWTRWIRSFSVASFSLPGLLVIGMMTLLFRGTEFRFGLASVVIAHAFLNAPWIAVATAEGIRSVPRGWVDAARTLGATRTRAFFRIELPWIARRIAIAAAQVFALCLMSFAIVLVLGGGPPVSTLETEIFAAVRGSGLELSKAAWFGLSELVLAAIPLMLAVGFRSRTNFRDTLASRTLTRAPTSVRSQIAHAVAATWLILPGVCFLRSASFAELSDVLRNPEFHEALGVSLEIAISVAVASLIAGGVFALGARNSRFVRMIAAFPAGLSPLLVSLGFFLAYSSWIDPFEGSLLGMVGVQTTLFLPFALRFFLPLIDEERTGPRRDLRLAARTLGASEWMAWKKLEWPRWQSAGLRLAALVFVWSFSELAAASFFGSERLTTLGVLLVRWLAQYRFDEVNLVLFGIYIFSAGVLLVTGKEEA
jgi:thiamine transport system permease protein